MYSEIGDVKGEKRGAKDDTRVMKSGFTPRGGDMGAAMVVTKGAGMVNSMCSGAGGSTGGMGVGSTMGITVTSSSSKTYSSASSVGVVC